MARLNRKDILELLSRWESGEIHEQTVHEEAERMWADYEGPRELPRSDPEAIPLEAIAQLEVLNHQLITRDDITTFREFLATPEGAEEEAWHRWCRYWDTLDLDERRAALRENPYYAI